MVEVLIFIIGLIIGSFLNMLIYRLPLKISLFNPKRSICPKCKNNLSWYENIPLISYIVLKAQCKTCKEKIAIRYPLVELLSAVFITLLYHQLGLSYDFLIISLIMATLIVLSMIDLHYQAVPDYLLVLALVGAFFVSNFSFYDCLLFAGGAILLEFFVTFYIQNIKSKFLKDETLLNQKALGEGDIPIFALIGGILGTSLGVVAIFLAALFAIIPSIFNIINKKKGIIPFIPFLTAGFCVVYLAKGVIIIFLEQLY